MSARDTGLRVSWAPRPTSPTPLLRTQMKVGGGLESALQVRVTESLPSLTADEDDDTAVAFGGTSGELFQLTGDKTLTNSLASN